MLPEFFEFYNPTKVIFGVGISNDFSSELSVLSFSRIFVITDKGVRQTGMVDKIINNLKEQNFEVGGIFDEVPPNSELKVVKSVASLCKESSCDAILAIGGGSVIDTAKGANILVSEGGDLYQDYSGAHTLTHPLNPLIVIPTTAGTGSEVTMVAVIYNEDEHVKIPFTDKFILPNLAILDPELTISLPSKMTAATGMDALTHAIEAYVSVQASPLSDALAKQAIKMIKDNLVTVVKDGKNIEARSNMLIASCMAGIAFSHSMVGCIHGMAHACGGLFGVPHGVANTILLPYGMKYNLNEVNNKFAELAKIWDIDISGCDNIEASMKLIENIKELQQELNKICGIPVRLSEVGIKEENLEEIAQGTVNDGTSFYNPREVLFEEIIKVLKEAL